MINRANVCNVNKKKSGHNYKYNMKRLEGDTNIPCYQNSVPEFR